MVHVGSFVMVKDHRWLMFHNVPLKEQPKVAKLDVFEVEHIQSLGIYQAAKITIQGKTAYIRTDYLEEISK